MNKVQWIGADISAENIKIACRKSETWAIQTIDNKSTAIEAWIKSLRPAACQIVVEATGSYSAKMIERLHALSMPFSIITPRQAKQFSGVLKNITKNDERDACCLALFGQHMQPPRSQAPTKEQLELQQLRSVLRQLKKQRRALLNHHHALQQLPSPSSQAANSLQCVLEEVEKQIQSIEHQLINQTKEAWKDHIRKMTSVKGIGPKTAIALLIATNGMQHFTDVKQLVKFAGLAPTQRQSGKSIALHGHINRAADPELRSLLYMATWSACKSNQACIKLRKKLINNGKAPKVALIAVAHKLLRQVWGVLKNNAPFDNNYETQHASA